MKKTRFTVEQIYWGVEGSRNGYEDPEALPQARHLGRDLLQVALEVRRDGGLGGPAEENRKLKHIVAEQALDIRVLKDVVAKKWCRLTPAVTRSAK